MATRPRSSNWPTEVLVHMEMITAPEKQLIGLNESDSLPTGGVEHSLYSFSGFVADSTKSWSDRTNSLKCTLYEAFQMEFHPGSLNVRRVVGIPWYPPMELNPRKIQLGVFELAYVLPIVLNEKCIGIVSAINVRGFNPATGERLLPPLQLGGAVEMYQIYSPVNIRKRLNLEDTEKSDNIPINVRVLSGNLLTLGPPHLQIKSTILNLDENYESRNQ